MAWAVWISNPLILRTEYERPGFSGPFFLDFCAIFLSMKALKSEFAKSILRDPESARALLKATLRAGYGPENGVSITVRPLQEDGTRLSPVTINVHKVPKAA